MWIFCSKSLEATFPINNYYSPTGLSSLSICHSEYHPCNASVGCTDLRSRAPVLGGTFSSSSSRSSLTNSLITSCSLQSLSFRPLLIFRLSFHCLSTKSSRGINCTDITVPSLIFLYFFVTHVSYSLMDTC